MATRYYVFTNGHNKLYALMSAREPHPDLKDLRRLETFSSLTDARKERRTGQKIVCFHFVPDGTTVDYIKEIY